MKLHILSDLHLDHQRGLFELEEVEHDVLVSVDDVQGSVIGGIEVLGKMNKQPVVFVGGNHEFYDFEGASLVEAYGAGRERAGEGGPVHLLENEALVLNRVRFLGTTLWTDYALYSEEQREAEMEAARQRSERSPPDPAQEARKGVTSVPAFDGPALHRKALQWLSGALCEPFDGPTFVCTYHGPHRRSIAT